MLKLPPGILEEGCFERRQALIDDLEFHISEAQAAGEDPDLIQQAQACQGELQQADQRLFARLRQAIRSAGLHGAVFYQEINRLVTLVGLVEKPIPAGFDSLDALITGLLLPEPAPEAVFALAPEMAYYEPTPARVIFELVRRLDLNSADVFYDLGSGLGHVPALAHLLSGARAIGVEIDPAFCAYARQSASGLGLTRVTYLNQDARKADYSCGTVFFLYTPFEGQVLAATLKRLRGEAARRQIRICAAGYCVWQVAQQSWLTPLTPVQQDYLTIFQSTEA